MKQLLLFIFAVIFSTTHSHSQKSLNDYAYILVPQQFDFQSNKDQYRLNTLVRHLFNQSGFKALYEEELGSLPRCEGVYASVIEERAFLSTKVVITISDCFNNELYRSQVGQSKEKDRSISYAEAIRNAFKSIQALNIKQKDLSEIQTLTHSKSTDKFEKAVEKEVEIDVDNTDTDKYTSYLFNGETYFLETTGANYVLYKKTGNTLVKTGVLNATSRAGTYLFETEKESNLANFDENKNLLIDGKDDSGNTVQHTYLLVKE